LNIARHLLPEVAARNPRLFNGPQKPPGLQADELLAVGVEQAVRG
jgi:hypothetical protein